MMNPEFKEIANVAVAVLRAMVTNKDDVKARVEGHQMSGIVTLSVHKDDKGIALGKARATFNELSEFIAGAGNKIGTSLKLAPIDTPNDGKFGEERKFNPNGKLETAWLEIIAKLMADKYFLDDAEIGVTHSDYTTMIDFAISPRAQRRASLEMFRVLFMAAGKANGRIVFVSFSDLEESEAQPKSAGGRFCGEIKGR